MKLRNLFFGFVALTTICYAKGQTCTFLANPNITIDTISGTITHNVGITDTDSRLGLKLGYTPPLELLDVPNIKYISVTPDVENSQLVFELTAEFLNLDQNEANTHGADYTIIQPLHLNCGQDTTLVFYLPVRDTNGHEPEFLQASYEIVAALPLPPKFDLTALGNVIKAKDIDLSNDNIIFELEPLRNFVLTTKLDPEDPLGKTYIAEIKVSRYTWLPADETFTLTATDSGENSRIGSTYFKITVDQENSVPETCINPPKYSLPLYEATYEIVNNVPSVTLTVNETISVSDGENNAVSVLPPYDAYFELIIQEDNTYELSPTEILGDDILTENIEIFVYLDAAADVETVQHGTAVVAIKLPQ